MKYILKNRIFVFILMGPFIILFMIFTIDISKRRQNN